MQGTIDVNSDHWDEHDETEGVLVSKEYTTEIHIPFTQRTLEIGLVGGVSKTFAYDVGLDRIQNYVKEPTEKEYYKIGGVKRKSREYDGGVGYVLTGRKADTPEISTPVDKVTYKQIQEDCEMVLVVEMTVTDLFIEQFDAIQWDISEIQSIKRVERDEISELNKKYPTGGYVPEYIEQIKR